jgi:hypothetical protein
VKALSSNSSTAKKERKKEKENDPIKGPQLPFLFSENTGSSSNFGIFLFFHYFS